MTRDETEGDAPTKEEEVACDPARCAPEDLAGLPRRPRGLTVEGDLLEGVITDTAEELGKIG